MTVEENELVEVKLVDVGSGRGTVDVHGVEVVCQGEGQTTLTLTVANTRSSALPYPHKVHYMDSVLLHFFFMYSLLAFSPHLL